MIVQIIINRERIGGGFRTVLINTALLRNYIPIGNNMPHNLADMIENRDNTEILDGPDWWDEEDTNMRNQGVIFEPHYFERSFEIAYC